MYRILGVRENVYKEIGGVKMLLFLGIAILIVMFISSNNIEKSLKSIESQNRVLISLLNDKNKEKPSE